MAVIGVPDPVNHPSDILSAHYLHSSEHFGVSIPSPSSSDLEMLLDCYKTGSLEDWTFMTASLRAMYSIPAQLGRRSYVSRLSRDLSSLLEANPAPLRVDTVLDVGSGPNPDIDEISRLTGADRYICVDPELPPGSNAFVSLSDFQASQANDLRRCLVIIRSTLHHIMTHKQREVFLTIASLSARRLHMLVVEDSPNLLPQYGGRCLACSAAQTNWNYLSEAQRFDLLQTNDIWTNCISYGRDRMDLYFGFRAPQAWIAMVKNSGFDITASFYEGFHHERLHCVPTFRLIAELRFPALPLMVQLWTMAFFPCRPTSRPASGPPDTPTRRTH